MNRVGIQAVRATAGVVALLTSMCGAALALDNRPEPNPATPDRNAVSAPQGKPHKPARKSGRKPARKLERTVQAAETGAREIAPGVRLTLKATPDADAGGMATVRHLWEQLVPLPQSSSPLEIRAENFSLSLDPARYPVIPAADGGKIVIDAERNLPPLIRSLIQEKDPGIRIVSERPTAGKQFFTPLLQAAGFYSVEPDFTVEYGDDPRLTVRADYRIERTAESLVHNDTLLLFTGTSRYALPGSLQGLLKQGGFKVVEPDLPPHDPVQPRNRFVRVPSGDPLKAADTVLSAFNIPAASGKSIALNGWAEQGISLSVRVERQFEVGGKPYALAAFDGNPVTYTLTRLLETQGVSVLVIGPQDGSRDVTQKLLQALQVPARYQTQRLWPLQETPYTVQMSGFLCREQTGDRSIFLTDRDIDPFLGDLIGRNGYAVTGR